MHSTVLLPCKELRCRRLWRHFSILRCIDCTTPIHRARSIPSSTCLQRDKSVICGRIKASILASTCSPNRLWIFTMHSLAKYNQAAIERGVLKKRMTTLTNKFTSILCKIRSIIFPQTPKSVSEITPEDSTFSKDNNIKDATMSTPDTLRSLSDIYRFFRNNTTPIYFVSPPHITFLDWGSGFRALNISLILRLFRRRPLSGNQSDRIPSENFSQWKIWPTTC